MQPPRRSSRGAVQKVAGGSKPVFTPQIPKKRRKTIDKITKRLSLPATLSEPQPATPKSATKSSSKRPSHQSSARSNSRKAALNISYAGAEDDNTSFASSDTFSVSNLSEDSGDGVKEQPKKAPRGRKGGKTATSPSRKSSGRSPKVSYADMDEDESSDSDSDDTSPQKPSRRKGVRSVDCKVVLEPLHLSPRSKRLVAKPLKSPAKNSAKQKVGTYQKALRKSFGLDGRSSPGTDDDEPQSNGTTTSRTPKRPRKDSLSKKSQGESKGQHSSASTDRSSGRKRGRPRGAASKPRSPPSPVPFRSSKRAPRISYIDCFEVPESQMYRLVDEDATVQKKNVKRGRKPVLQAKRKRQIVDYTAERIQGEERVEEARGHSKMARSKRTGRRDRAKEDEEIQAIHEAKKQLSKENFVMKDDTTLTLNSSPSTRTKRSRRL